MAAAAARQREEGTADHNAAFHAFRRTMKKTSAVGSSNEEAVQMKAPYFQSFYNAVNLGHLVAIPVAGVVAAAFEGSEMRNRYTNGELGRRHGIWQMIARMALMLLMEFTTDFVKGLIAKAVWKLDFTRHTRRKMSTVRLWGRGQSKSVNDLVWSLQSSLSLSPLSLLHTHTRARAQTHSRSTTPSVIHRHRLL